MNNKARIDSVLSQLSADEQAQIYEWLITLGYTKTIEKMALPRPDGLNTHTHRNSLHRFFKRYQKEACADDLVVAKESRPISTEDASLLFRRRKLLPPRRAPDRHRSHDPGYLRQNEPMAPEP